MNVLRKKPAFGYRVDLKARMFRIALAKLERQGDITLLRRYLAEGGKITDLEELVRAIIASEPRRGKPPYDTEAAERAADILTAESRLRKATPNKRLPYRTRPGLVKRHVNEAWLAHGRLQPEYKRLTDQTAKRQFEEKFKVEAKDDILLALGNLRKNEPRKLRKKTR